MGFEGALSIIKGLRDRVASFELGLSNGRFVGDIIRDNEAYIIDMNAEDQLFDQGINNLGVNISDYMPYSPYTIEIKELKGQPTDRVTLRDEGDFESSFFLEVGNTAFEIKAADFKTEGLIKKYGRQILGLTDDNISKLIWQYIFPDICKLRDKVIYGTN